MTVSHSDMEDALKELGCRTVHKVKKVTEYMLPGTKEPFYVHVENRCPQIVVRPAFHEVAPELGKIEGVRPKDPFYHNADMTRFPSKKHKGKTECNFGWAFEFDNTMALRSFINFLVFVVK
ncbi:hypothetical protein [Marinobacterium sedimentorum]|uniref:hypothetical protein n=1 Tax=Marinobacterium sedimentorum TaxID=2927804 RepID=UPI0020C6CEBD|nr:hypothetical protein [Marinobacterium sedimentorum]MCP8687126.1 hypothetical protein [Marinobacterium sedimentorum]